MPFPVLESVCHGAFSCHIPLGSSWPWCSSDLAFDDHISFEECWSVTPFSMSLNWDVSDVFLLSEVMYSLEENCRGKVPFLLHYINGIYYQHDLSCWCWHYHLAEGIFLRSLSIVESLFFLSFQTVLFGRKSLWASCFKECGITLICSKILGGRITI